jgi:hypothetical protein
MKFGFQPAHASHFGTRTFPESAFCSSAPPPLGNLYVLSGSALSFADRQPRSLPTTHLSLPTILFRIRTSAKHTRNSFRIRTSKTKDLKPFRIRTYEKTPRGEGTHHPAATAIAERSGDERSEKNFGRHFISVRRRPRDRESLQRGRYSR